MKVRHITEEHACHRDGGRRCAERGNGDADLELLHQFLQHEYRAGDRCVESRGQSGAGAGGEQYSTVRHVAPEYPSHEMTDARAHLYAGSLSTEGEARADREQSADELDRHQSKRRVRQFSPQYRLDVRDAAPRCGRRESAHQPGCNCNCRRTCGRDEQESGEWPAVRPDNERGAQMVAVFECEAERRSDESGTRADDERQQRERQQAACVIRTIDVGLNFGRHRRPDCAALSPSDALSVTAGGRLIR